MLGWGRQLSREAVDAAAASGLQPRPRSGHERPDLRGRPFGSGRKAAPNGASGSGRRRASKKPKLDSIDEDGEPSEEQIQRLLAEAQNWEDKEDEMKASLLRNMPSLDVARLRAAEAEINAARTRLQQSFWPHKCCLPLFAAADAINELEPREQARARAFESCTSSSVDGATPSLRITETGNHAEVVYQGVLLAAVLPVPEFHCSCCSEVWYPDAPTLLCFPSSPTGIKLDGATSGYTRWIALAVLDNFHRLSNGGGVSAQAYAAFLEETQRETAACGAYLGGSLGALKFHKFDDKLLLNAYFAHRRLIVPLADERDMGITFKDGALQDCSACSTVIVDGELSFNEHATIMMDGSYTMRANKGGAKAAIAAEERSGTGLRTIGRYFAPGPNREVAAAAPAVRRAAPKSRFNARHNRIRACRQFSEELAPTRAAAAFGIGGAVWRPRGRARPLVLHQHAAPRELAHVRCHAAETDRQQPAGCDQGGVPGLRLHVPGALRGRVRAGGGVYGQRQSGGDQVLRRLAPRQGPPPPPLRGQHRQRVDHNQRSHCRENGHHSGGRRCEIVCGCV